MSFFGKIEKLKKFDFLLNFDVLMEFVANILGWFRLRECDFFCCSSENYFKLNFKVIENGRIFKNCAGIREELGSAAMEGVQLCHLVP